MYSLFENYSETPPYLVLFCAYVLIPVQILFRKMRKKKVEATLVDFGKIPQLRIRPNSTQNFSIHIDDH
jgi:hypothetical protein